MEEHAKLALASGVKRALVPINGSAIRLAPEGPRLLSHEPAGRLVLDGDIILPADGATIVERRRLAHNGLIAVSVVMGRNGLPAATPQVSAHGVPVEEDKAEFLAACADAAEKAAAKGDAKRQAQFAEAIRVAVRRVAREWTGKKPVTDVQVTRL
jgi:ribonuclease J